MKTRILLTLCLGFISFGSMAQQDPLYSQYNFNKLAFNPAYAGIYDMAMVSAIFRKQWIQIPESPTTFTFSGHTSLPLDKAGAGLVVISDHLGAVSITEIEAAFSYKLVSPSGDNKLSMGLNIGMINNKVDNSKVEVADAGDVNFEGQASITKPTVGFGLFYTTPTYFVGLSVPKILNIDFDNGEASGLDYNRHYYLNAGYLFELNTKGIKLVPSTWIKYVKGANLSFDGSITGIFNEKIWGTFGFRTAGFIYLNGQLQVSDVMKVGVAFDFTSKQNMARYMTFELMANFNLPVFDFHAVQPVYF